MAFSDEYKCERCGQPCDGNPDANAEAEKVWGVKDAESKIGKEMAVVCQDCYELLMNYRKN